MKKKLLGALLITAVMTGVLGGCGSKNESPAEEPAAKTEAETVSGQDTQDSTGMKIGCVFADLGNSS